MATGYPPELEGIRLKIARAKTHIDNLNRSMRRFMDSNPYGIEVEQYTETMYRSVLRIYKGPPLNWSLTAGDAIHNLRSALDHLAWQLALKTTNEPFRYTAFPISDAAERFSESPALKDIFRPAIPVIEGLQPYHAADSPRNRGLRFIADVDNVDKHRLVIPIFATTSIGTPKGLPIGFNISLGRLTDGHVLAIGGSPQAARRMRVAVNLALYIPSLSPPIAPVGVLRGMHDYVRDEVIPLFFQFFQ